MSPPLEGIRVLDLTIAQQGPAATAMLADMGAEVIKIESWRGDPGRGVELQPDGTSAFFLTHNRNKKSVTVNLRKPRGKEIIHRLAERSDVMVQSWAPGVVERLALDYDTIRRHNPQIIYGSATSFGPRGPRAALPAMDMVAQGAGGLMMANAGPEGDQPLPVGPTIADQAGAFLLACGIILALYHKQRTGEGQKVDVSLLGSQIALQSWHVVHFQLTGAMVMGAGRLQRAPLFNYYRAADAWFTIAIIDPRQWPALCRLIGREALAADPRFAETAQRNANAAALIEILDDVFGRRPRQEWLGLFEGEQIPCGPVNSYADLLHDPQVLANDYMVSVAHPALATLLMPGPAVELSRTPCALGSPAPELGQHTEEVLSWLGYTWEEIGELRKGKVV